MWSILYASASDEEKEELETQMRSEPELSKILDAINNPDVVDVVHEEQQRILNARRARVAAEIDMEVDQETADAGGQVAGIRKVLDLADLASGPSAHVSDKKSSVPAGYERRTRDGYEEHFIPAAKRREVTEVSFF